MAFFRPTHLWELSQLIVPGVGTVIRRELMEIDPKSFLAIWLLQNKYIAIADPNTVPPDTGGSTGGSGKLTLTEFKFMLQSLITSDTQIRDDIVSVILDVFEDVTG